MLEIPRITVDSGYTGEQLLQLIEQTAVTTFQKKSLFFKVFRHKLRVTGVIGLIVLAILFKIVKVRNKKII